MAQEPFSERGQDGAQRDDAARLLSGRGSGDGAGPRLEDDWDAEAALAAEAEEWDLPLDWLAGDDPPPLAGFRHEGTADLMGPGPALAALVYAAVQDPAALDEDQLVGVIAAIRRIESRMAWASMTAMRELAARRPPGRDQAGAAADELALELRQSWQSVAGQIEYACLVAARLPRTFAALAAGQIHPVHVRIIEDETRYLKPADAARADEELAETAASKSFGELRYAAHRLVLKLDPDVARRRKEEKAKREAHVRRFREDSGNAGMVARELPPDEVLASWQHVEQRARDLRAAGVPGSLRELRIRAYLDLLQERDSRATVVRPGGSDPGGGGPQGEDGPGGGGRPGNGPAGSGGAGTRAHPASDPGPSVAALVTITVPLTSMPGQSAVPGQPVPPATGQSVPSPPGQSALPGQLVPAGPGEVGGFGLLDAADIADLLVAAAAHPRTRWCLTVLNPDGTAAAHGCAPGRHTAPLDLSRFTLTRVIRGPCDHAQAEPGYTPSRRLRHLVATRSTRCTAPGCGRPAASCDLDHSVPWQDGGLTCPCNLSPLCRHHHKCKQRDGWTLEQPEPGVLVWRTPVGRTYTTTPSQDPV